MLIYPLDIDPDQVIRWIRAEQEASPAFRIMARRTAEVREIPIAKEAHLGDEEREDLSEVATIATLEITPAHASDGWRLTVIVEDEAGPRVPDRGATTEPDQQIDIGTFYKEFIRPGRGNASVVAEAVDPAAKARVTRLLSAIETNRHSGPGNAARGGG